MYIKREARVECVLRNGCARYGGLKDNGKRVDCLRGIESGREHDVDLA